MEQRLTSEDLPFPIFVSAAIVGTGLIPPLPGQVPPQADRYELAVRAKNPLTGHVHSAPERLGTVT